MNENKFTPRAEEALRLSQEAAGELGHGYVGTEHLLLGLIREDEGMAHEVLTEAGLTDDMIVEIIKRSVGAGLPGSNPAQGLTPRAKRVVEIAMEDSVRGGYNYIGTEHLLAGILREGNNMAVRILRTAGVDARHLYTALMQKLNETPRGKAAEAIQRGAVQVNHTVCLKPDKPVAAGDVITCRGWGRCVLGSVGSPARKGRLPIVIQRYS